jgi:anti-sigma factor RsiW
MAPHPKFDCETQQAALEDYLDGELSAGDREKSTEHLERCPACRAAVQDASISVSLLRLREPSPDPGPGFARTVMARIRAAENERVTQRANFWQPFVSLGWRFAATATLALVALVTYDAGWRHRPQPNMATARPTLDIFAPEPDRVPVTGDEVLMMVAADNGHEKP